MRYKIKRTVGLFGTLLLLASCGTPEFQNERNICQSTWTSKIPQKLVREIFSETRSREVPTGRTICKPQGTATICDQVMRTEYFSVPVVRTIDVNKPRRDAQIRSCTQTSCTRKFGNAECKI